MYLKNEIPKISASVFYYDTVYQQSTAERVLEILERNQMFIPERLCADHLTRGRLRKYTPEMREVFLNAYAEPDVLGIEWEAGDPRSSENYLGFTWSLTFLKSRDHIESAFHPWNIITFNACYGWLQDPTHQAKLLRCMKELSFALGAFCAIIDDIAQRVALRHRTGERTFSPDHIQQVYWGNYWGAQLLSLLQLEKLRELHLPNYEETTNGVFFTLTDNVFDFNSRICNAQRLKAAKLICREKCK